MYGLLMQVSAAAIKDLCADKRHLRGLARHAVGAPHPWNGRLGYHPHVHLLITGGGITADGQHYKCRRGESSWCQEVAVLSRKIAANGFARTTWRPRHRPSSPRSPPTSGDGSGSPFCKHYGHGGNDAVLDLSVAICLSHGHHQRTDPRYGPNPCDLPRWKDRGATSAWRIERLPGVEFLRRLSSSTSCREGFTRSDTTGFGTPRGEDQSNRAWVLLILATPADPARPR